MNESKSLDEVPINLETGLLSIVRKRISLLPDRQVYTAAVVCVCVRCWWACCDGACVQVRNVLGPVLTHESVIVMADSSSILVRTAVCRVRVVLLLTILSFNVRFSFFLSLMFAYPHSLSPLSLPVIW